MKTKFLTISSILLISLSSHSSEIDSFTRRYEKLVDSAEIINIKANDYLKAAIVRSNLKNECDKKNLYEEIRKDYNIILNKGNFINEIVSSDEIPKHVIQRKDSIFKYHTIYDGYLLARPAADLDGIGMGTTMNFNGIYIGSDKFEHMFGQGYHYFKRFYYKSFSLKRVLMIGIANERLHLGGNQIATGVYTYSDLVANFQGMRFWNHLLQEGEDLINENLGPYIECQNNQWKLVKEVDFKNYIDDGFDEGINCSSLITENGLWGVLQSLEELKNKFPENNFNCPLDPKKLMKVKEKYSVPVNGIIKKKLSDYLLNPWNKISDYKMWWYL